MKTTFILAAALLLCELSVHAQVAVNTSGAAPAASAMLDVTSAGKGVLIPRMSAFQRGQIPAPATGLLVFQTEAPVGYYYYNGTNWKQMIDATALASNPPANDLLSFDGTNWVAKSLLVTGGGSGAPVPVVQPYLCMNYCISLFGIFPTRNGANPFIGELELFAFNFAPVGFATCDGQILPISQNQALFALLGTYYGGDGITTFRLPDLRGRVPIHQGQGPGLSPYYIGQVGGSETIALSPLQLPAHTHTVIYQ